METLKLYNGLNIPCIGFGTDRTFIYFEKHIGRRYCVLERCNCRTSILLET